MSDIKLLPCPFCGEIPCFSHRESKINVRCWKPNCRGGQSAGYASEMYSTYEEAAAAWNTRKPIDRIVERLEELKNQYTDDCFVQKMMAAETAIDIVKEASNG